MARGPYTPLSETIKIAAIAILRNRGRMRTSDLHKEIAANVGCYGHNPWAWGYGMTLVDHAEMIFRRTYERIRGRLYPQLACSYGQSLESLIATVVDALVKSRRVRRFLDIKDHLVVGANKGSALYGYQYSIEMPVEVLEMDVLDRVASVL